MSRRTVQAADSWLTLQYRESNAWDRNAQRESAGGHLLTTRAVASHRQQRRNTYFKSYLSATASTFPRQFPVIHNPRQSSLFIILRGCL